MKNSEFDLNINKFKKTKCYFFNLFVNGNLLF
jgi:hypothetical protein